MRTICQSICLSFKFHYNSSTDTNYKTKIAKQIYAKVTLMKNLQLSKKPAYFTNAFDKCNFFVGKTSGLFDIFQLIKYRNYP